MTATATQETITVYELSQASGLSAEQLHELVEYAALHPVQPNAMVFSTACVAPLRTACALQADYDLDLFTVGVLVGYLFRIESLERQVRTLRAHLPVHVAFNAEF